MEKHTKLEALDILLDEVMQIENDLLSDTIQSWLSTQSDQDKVVYGERIFKVSIYRSKLQNLFFDIILEEFNKIVPQLKDGVTSLQREIQDAKDFINAMETLDKVLGFIARVVTVAAAPSSAPFAIAKEVAKSRAAHMPRVMMLREEPEAMLPESSVIEKSVAEERRFLLIEEVLYGVALTEDELIITVATGGKECTKQEDFRFDVNKGAKEGKEWTKGQEPYIVTVYRIVSDECYKAPGVISISYSRKELGLDGSVEFILRNKIGNTSNHRVTS